MFHCTSALHLFHPRKSFRKLWEQGKKKNPGKYNVSLDTSVLVARLIVLPVKWQDLHCLAFIPPSEESTETIIGSVVQTERNHINMSKAFPGCSSSKSSGIILLQFEQVITPNQSFQNLNSLVINIILDMIHSSHKSPTWVTAANQNHNRHHGYAKWAAFWAAWFWQLISAEASVFLLLAGQNDLMTGTWQILQVTHGVEDSDPLGTRSLVSAATQLWTPQS